MAGLSEYQQTLSAYQDAQASREARLKEIINLEGQAAKKKAGLIAEYQQLLILKQAARLAILEQRGLGWCSFSHTGQFIGGWDIDQSDPKGVYPLREMKWVYEHGLALPHYNSMARTPMTISSRDGQLFLACPSHYVREFEWGHNRSFNQPDPIRVEGIRSDVEARGDRLFAIYPELRDVTDVQRLEPKFVPNNLDPFLGLSPTPSLVLP